MLDPPATGSSKKSNLSLPFIIERLSLEENAEVAGELEEVKCIFSSSGLKKYRNKILSHNDAKTAFQGESLSINLDASELESLVERIGNLYFTIKYAAGLEDVDRSLDPLVTLPFDKNGPAFISKLKRCMRPVNQTDRFRCRSKRRLILALHVDLDRPLLAELGMLSFTDQCLSAAFGYILYFRLR